MVTIGRTGHETILVLSQEVYDKKGLRFLSVGAADLLS